MQKIIHILVLTLWATQGVASDSKGVIRWGRKERRSEGPVQAYIRRGDGASATATSEGGTVSMRDFVEAAEEKAGKRRTPPPIPTKPDAKQFEGKPEVSPVKTATFKEGASGCGSEDEERGGGGGCGGEDEESGADIGTDRSGYEPGVFKDYALQSCDFNKFRELHTPEEIAALGARTVERALGEAAKYRSKVHGERHRQAFDAMVVARIGQALRKKKLGLGRGYYGDGHGVVRQEIELSASELIASLEAAKERLLFLKLGVDAFKAEHDRHGGNRRPESPELEYGARDAKTTPEESMVTFIRKLYDIQRTREKKASSSK